ncbi:hypothetical protein [Trueperella sp. LYQ143]|uniref:hypothetical protein n=1 Tax=unclassified Trueperella TaxID=2630174 RepID=UPI0039833BC8
MTLRFGKTFAREQPSDWEALRIPERRCISFSYLTITASVFTYSPKTLSTVTDQTIAALFHITADEEICS